MVHAAKHASAHRIIAVTPWYGYSRQDKKSAPREPISARLVAELLETAGIDRLVTMDLHAGQMQGFFSKPVDHMTAMPILTQLRARTSWRGDDLVIIAPDAGRVKLVRKFAQKVGAPYALLEKERPAQQVAEIGYVIGDVKGKVAVIVDDIIDTGGTLAAAAQTVLDEGARAGVRRRHPRRSSRATPSRRSPPRRWPASWSPTPCRCTPDAPDSIRVLTTRRHPHRLGPPDLHRRLGVGDLPGREPAVLSTSSARPGPSLHWPTAWPTERPSLTVEERSERGSREARRLRRAGFVPAVLYGASHPDPFAEGRRARAAPPAGRRLRAVRREDRRREVGARDPQGPPGPPRPRRGDARGLPRGPPRREDPRRRWRSSSRAPRRRPASRRAACSTSPRASVNIEALPTDIPERIVVNVVRTWTWATRSPSTRSPPPPAWSSSTSLEEITIATVVVPTKVEEPEIEEETELIGEDGEPIEGAPRARRAKSRRGRGPGRGRGGGDSGGGVAPSPWASSAADGGGGKADWLIVGLGNPGEKYARTRHNVGFEVANLAAERWGLPRGKKKYGGLYHRAAAPARAARAWRVLLPQTFMNESGRAVSPAAARCGVDLDHVVAVHDEIDLPFGRIEARLGGGLAGHNGLKSLKRELGGPDFHRIRVGVGRPDSTDPEIVSAHVLGPLQRAEGRGPGAGGGGGRRARPARSTGPRLDIDGEPLTTAAHIRPARTRRSTPSPRRRAATPQRAFVSAEPAPVPARLAARRRAGAAGAGGGRATTARRATWPPT